MKNLLKTTRQWLYTVLVVITIPANCLTASAQIDGEGIRFNMFTASNLVVIAGSDPLVFGTGSYTYNYGTNGSNATLTATLPYWFQADAYLPNGYSIDGTNFWSIDPAGVLTIATSLWRTLTNNVVESTWADDGTYEPTWGPWSWNANAIHFPPWQNAKAKGNIPALRLSGADCKLDLVLLGERPDFTNDVIVRFTVSATDADTGLPIPDSDISIASKPVTDGVAWTKFKEWSIPDVTPVICGHDNYTFELIAEIARPQLGL